MKKAPLRSKTSQILLTLLIATTTTAMAKTSLIYIATQDPGQMGITVAEFDSDTGVLSAPRMVIETRDPAHFTLSDDGKHLYMCNTGTPGGVSAFAVGQEDRRAEAAQLQGVERPRPELRERRSEPGATCSTRTTAAATSRSIRSRRTVRSSEQTAFVQHEGSSVHPQRQTKPYAHWFRTDPSNKFGLVADLGTDKIVVYKFDAKTGKLTPNDPPATKVAGGMGPRHLVFHPNGKWVYGIAEIANEVMAFNWDGKKGTLTQFQSVKTLADGFTEPSTAAEIAVREDGKFLYASNRGEDSIVVYAIDAKTGELTLKQRTSSRGKVPRYFTLDPTNKWLIVSNQEGANVSVFSVDAKTGELAPQGEPVLIGEADGRGVSALKHALHCGNLLRRRLYSEADSSREWLRSLLAIRALRRLHGATRRSVVVGLSGRLMPSRPAVSPDAVPLRYLVRAMNDVSGSGYTAEEKRKQLVELFLQRTLEDVEHMRRSVPAADRGRSGRVAGVAFRRATRGGNGEDPGTRACSRRARAELAALADEKFAGSDARRAVPAERHERHRSGGYRARSAGEGSAS